MKGSSTMGIVAGDPASGSAGNGESTEQAVGLGLGAWRIQLSSNLKAMAVHSVPV